MLTVVMLSDPGMTVAHFATATFPPGQVSEASHSLWVRLFAESTLSVANVLRVTILQNSPTVPTRTRSIATIASALTTIRIVESARACPKFAMPG
jgi:hypothetical protein